MKNTQKTELKQIVRSIPISECNQSISKLWKEYAEDFTYGTFRQYFKVFNQLNGTTKLKEGNYQASAYFCWKTLPKDLIIEILTKLTTDGIPPKPKDLGILPTII